MLELILIRHGETDSNKKGTYLGWTDVELNDAGIRQAEAIAHRLKNIKIDRIYTSSLKRAYKTAEIISFSHNTNIIPSDSLKERNFGAFDDLTCDEIMSKYTEEYGAWSEDWVNYCIRNGESAIQAYNRVTGFINELVAGNKDGVFLITTHLGCIRVILAHMFGIGIEGTWRFKVDNCTMTKLMINNEKYAYLTMLNG